MRKLALISTGAIAMAVVAVAASFGASSSNAGPRDALWGGGHFQFAIGQLTLDRDFSVKAELGRFGQADGTFVYQARVDPVSCLSVSGNRAVIGGFDPNFGGEYLWYAVDNGTPAGATRDQVTPLLLLEPADLAQMPEGFPNVCPDPRTVVGGTPYSDLTAGDIVVFDAG